MRKILKWIGIILGGLVGLILLTVVGLAIYGNIKFKPTLKDRPLYPIEADMSPEGLARGKYLLENAMTCNEACHSPEGRPFVGVYENISMGPISGVFATPNLTPDKETGLGDWNDAEIARAIREGVDKDGVALVVMPAQEIFETYKNGEFITEPLEYISSVPHLNSIVIEEANLAERVKEGLAEAVFVDFEVNYVHTFDVGFPQPPCPPYEGLYREGEPRTSVMLEVSEFYKHFGLSMSQEGGKRELPDYLCAELEFLHFLTFKEAQAREKGDTEHLRGNIHAQKDFLERHMIDWFPKFHQKLEKSEAHPFSKDLGRIVMRFTTQEFGFVSKVLASFDN